MTHANLKRDYFWNTLGVFAQNAVSPLLLIAVTRVNGIFDSGIFSFAFSIAVIFLSLGMWGGRTFQASDAKERFTSQSYIAVRLILSVVMLVGAVAFCLANGYDQFKTSVILVLVLAKVFESISDAVYAVMQVRDSLYRSGISLAVKAVLSMVLFVAIDITTQNLLLASTGLILANILVLAFYDIPTIHKLEKNILKNGWTKSSAQAFKVMMVSLPVFAVTFLAMFSLNIPRYFLDMFHPESVGYFGILAMPITLLTLAVSFLLQPNVVSLSRLYNTAKFNQFRRVVGKILSATVVITVITLIVTFFIGLPVLHIAFGVDFSNYKLELMIMVAGAGASAFVAVLMSMMVILRRFKVPFYIFLLTNLVLVVLSSYIVNINGLLGSVSLFAGINVFQAMLFAVYYLVVMNGSSKANND